MDMFICRLQMDMSIGQIYMSMVISIYRLQMDILKMPPRRTYNERRVRVHLTKKCAHVHVTCM